jgi:hypothetical protein
MTDAGHDESFTRGHYQENAVDLEGELADHRVSVMRRRRA